MKVVVGGASGLIGSALMPVLRASGHDVVRLVRREPSAADEIRWDPAAGTLDASALQGVDAIVNLSGENIGQRWTQSRKREIRESRVNATSLLARTAATHAAPRPRVLVSASAIGIYPDRGDEILTEESGEAAGFLADVVRAWEAAADPARAAGIRVVTLRQSPVIARNGGPLERMLLPFKLGIGGRLGSGKQWFSWVSIDDLTAAYVHVLATDVNGVLNVTAPNPVTNQQLTRRSATPCGAQRSSRCPPSRSGRYSARWARTCSSTGSASSPRACSTRGSSSRRPRSTSPSSAHSPPSPGAGESRRSAHAWRKRAGAHPAPLPLPRLD
jgi:uncharacterized protein (TIGR01777 family)